MKRLFAFFVVAFCVVSARAAFEIDFMRHGETTWNRAKVLQGTIEYAPLSAKGVAITRATAAGMAAEGVKYERVFVSPYQRTRETAEIVAAMTGPRPVANELLRERCFGTAQGKRMGEGRTMQVLLAESTGVETEAEVSARARAFLESLRPLDGQVKRVLAVTHSHFLKGLVAALQGGKFDNSVLLPNNSISTVRYENGRFTLVSTGRIYYDAEFFDAVKQPRIIAHRGAGDLTMAEASRAAYQDAVKKRCDIVKLDLHRTKDGVIVLSHDDALTREMGWKVDIDRVTYAEIMEKGNYKDKGGVTGGKIVRLDEALEIVRSVPEFWIDFKYFSPEFAEAAVAEFVKSKIDLSRVMCATFTCKALTYLRKTHPEIRRIAHMGTRTQLKNFLEMKEYYDLWGINIAAHCSYETPSGTVLMQPLETIAELKRRGLWVSLHSIGNWRDHARYRGSGCDAYVSDSVSELRPESDYRLERVLPFVNPFIGTKGVGHCFPGAAYPFGLVQASPDTGEGSWQYCAGYQHGDTNFLGFSQTHLSGTGARDLLDFRFTLPGARQLKDETATPGYYAATLEPIGVRAEVTASEHAAIYRFTGTVVPEPEIPFALPTAHRHTEVWVKRDVYAATEVKRVSAGEVFVKIAISATDEKSALANLRAEIPDWDFAQVRARTAAKWEDLLGRVSIACADGAMKTNLYTALYHVCLQPHNLGDAGKAPRYSTFSCWDTFRAAHPLYTIFYPEYVAPFVNSLLDSCKTHDGMLPILAFWGEDGYNMVGHHAVPIVCDAILKGFEGIDRERAYGAVKESLTKGHRILRSTNSCRRTKENWDILEGHGFYPFDVIIGESVSRTLECAYDDACAARLAKLLGKKEDEAYFRARSCAWTNVFDRSLGCVRGKSRWGQWREPFDPAKVGAGELDWNDYTEGNALQYTWHVMHDPKGLIAAMGGKAAALKRLDALFDAGQGVSGKAVEDVTGLIGNYAHGNEPSHHVAWFYHYLGRDDLMNARIRQIATTFYHPTPDGLCGNDDCGQMSAWYVFACLGYYPFDPCGGKYIWHEPIGNRAAANCP